MGLSSHFADHCLIWSGPCQRQTLWSALCGGFLGERLRFGRVTDHVVRHATLTKGETSALRPYNVVILGVAVGIFAWQGYYTRETLILMAIALPATIVSSQIGIAVFPQAS